MSSLTLQPPIWFFNEESFPCRCCAAVDAIEEDVWRCRNERTWLVIEEEPLLEGPHDAAVCDGSCSNPFHTRMYLEIAHASAHGITWGDLNWQWENAAWNALSAEEQTRRKKEDAERKEKEKKESALKQVAITIADKVRHREITAHCKGNVGRKEMVPCKYLYSCQGKKPALPTTLHITTECWGWEYTDPATGEYKKPHACYYLHPGEHGWRKEWETDRRFGLDRRAPPGGFHRYEGHRHEMRRDGFQVAGGRAPLPYKAQPPQQHKPSNFVKKSRFATLDSDDD
jgi:hypothetical protein